MMKSNNKAILRKEKTLEKYAKNMVLAKSMEKFLLVKNLLPFNKGRKSKRQ